MLKTAIRLRSGVALTCSAHRDYRPFTKLLLAMKLTIVLLTTMLTCTAATGLSQAVTFSGKDVPLKQVFTAIEKQTGYVVFANRNTLEDARTVSISATKMPLTEFLTALLKDQPFRIQYRGQEYSALTQKILPPPHSIVRTTGQGYFRICVR